MQSRYIRVVLRSWTHHQVEYIQVLCIPRMPATPARRCTASLVREISLLALRSDSLSASEDVASAAKPTVFCCVVRTCQCVF